MGARLATTNAAVVLVVGLISGCAGAPPYIPPASGERTASFTVALEGKGFGGIQICDRNTGWKLVGEVGDGMSLHDEFFINYRVPPRSFQQSLPTGRRIKLGGVASSSANNGAGWSSSSNCVVAVSIVADPAFTYDAVWKLDAKGCSLGIYRTTQVNGEKKRMLEPTLERTDVACS